MKQKDEKPEHKKWETGKPISSVSESTFSSSGIYRQRSTAAIEIQLISYWVLCCIRLVLLLSGQAETQAQNNNGGEQRRIKYCKQKERVLSSVEWRGSFLLSIVNNCGRQTDIIAFKEQERKTEQKNSENQNENSCHPRNKTCRRTEITRHYSIDIYYSAE